MCSRIAVDREQASILTQFRIVSNCVAKFVTSNNLRRRFCESMFNVEELLTAQNGISQN